MKARLAKGLLMLGGAGLGAVIGLWAYAGPLLVRGDRPDWEVDSPIPQSFCFFAAVFGIVLAGYFAQQHIRARIWFYSVIASLVVAAVLPFLVCRGAEPGDINNQRMFVGWLSSAGFVVPLFSAVANARPPEGR